MINEFNDINDYKNNSISRDDIPQGLYNRMAENPEALQYFVNLSDAEKREIIAFVQNCSTGDEARQNVKTAVDMLCMHDASFINNSMF